MENDNLFPIVVKRMLPHLDEAIDTYGGMEEASEESLNKMASHIIRKSGLMSDPVPFHNERTLSDMARWLLISNIWGQDFDGCNSFGCNGFPFWPPWWGFFPPARPPRPPFPPRPRPPFRPPFRPR